MENNIWPETWISIKEKIREEIGDNKIKTFIFLINWYKNKFIQNKNISVFTYVRVCVCVYMCICVCLHLLEMNDSNKTRDGGGIRNILLW